MADTPNRVDLLRDRYVPEMRERNDLPDDVLDDYDTLRAWLAEQDWRGTFGGYQFGGTILTYHRPGDPRRPLGVRIPLRKVSDDANIGEIENRIGKLQTVAPVHVAWETFDITHQPRPPTPDTIDDLLEQLVEHTRTRYRQNLLDTRTYQLVEQVNTKLGGTPDR